MKSLVKLRLLSQQLVCPEYDDPAEVVSHFGAMQGQEYRLMRWAVSMRTKCPSKTSFEAAYNSGSIVRVHLLRGTWQLISGKDYAWMMRLFSQKARTVINGWMKANGISISESEYSYIRHLLLSCVSSLKSATKEDINKALLKEGISMDDHRLSYHLRMAELDGDLCNGDLKPMKMTYSVASNKLHQFAEIQLDESLYLLAQKYFLSHSPATLEDFVWWSGLSKTLCLKAISLLGNSINCEHCNGRDFYFHSSCRTDISLCPTGTFRLLPSYDEYLIGYKSRDIVLDPQFTHKAHNNSGNFSPIVLRNGEVTGNWSPFTKNIETSFFDPDFIPSSKLTTEINRYLKFRD